MAPERHFACNRKSPKLSRPNIALQWRHNGGDSVSNHQPHDCLLNGYSGADQRKHESSESLAFVRGIHRSPVNSPHKWSVTRRMVLFDDVIMAHYALFFCNCSQLDANTTIIGPGEIIYTPDRCRGSFLYPIDETHPATIALSDGLGTLNINGQMIVMMWCVILKESHVCFIKYRLTVKIRMGKIWYCLWKTWTIVLQVICAWDLHMSPNV